LALFFNSLLIVARLTSATSKYCSTGLISGGLRAVFPLDEKVQLDINTNKQQAKMN
jgi:hypothetical protein